MWRKGNPRALLVGMQIGAAKMENSMEVPQRIKDRTTIESSNSTSRYFSKEKKAIKSKICMNPYVHCSIINNSQIWKQPKCPLINGWIKKMWYINIQWNITQP